VRVVTTAAALNSVGAALEIAEIPTAEGEVILSAPVIVESPAAHPMIARRPPAPRERMRPVTDTIGVLPTASAELAETTTLPAETIAGSASPESQAPVDGVAAVPLEPVEAGEALAGASTTVIAATLEADNSQRDSSPTRRPWTAAAEAGSVIGRRSQATGVATAAFFNRFGRKIAASF